MIFFERDIDLLRLACWCQFINREQATDIFDENEIINLIRLKMIKLHEKSDALVITNRGREFLSGLFHEVPHTALSYREALVNRRLRISSIVLTAYRAGADPFTTAMSGIAQGPSLFLPAISRTRSSNPWGSTRIAAVAHLGEQFLAMHYVCPGIGQVALIDELTAYGNQTAAFQNARRGFFFAGKSLRDILLELDTPSAGKESKLVSYGDAWRRLQYPVYLLPCDSTGVTQLQIMAIPDYRRRLTLAALRFHYSSPPEDVPEWDAVMDGLPFVMAVDMDLRRIDAAIGRAQTRGIEKIAVAGLESQAEQVLYARYRKPGKARVFILPGETLEQAVGGPLKPYAPGRAQYVTEKGEVVDAPLIEAGRKAGRSH